MLDEGAGGSQDTTGLEGALARVERAVEASSKVVASLARELKRARAAAASGQVRELRRALDTGQAIAGDVVKRVGEAAPGRLVRSRATPGARRVGIAGPAAFRA